MIGWSLTSPDRRGRLGRRPTVARVFALTLANAETIALVAATALAVGIYGAGLPAFVLQKVVSPLYYARHDTRTPFRFAVHAITVGLNVRF